MLENYVSLKLGNFCVCVTLICKIYLFVNPVRISDRSFANSTVDRTVPLPTPHPRGRGGVVTPNPSIRPTQPWASPTRGEESRIPPFLPSEKIKKWTGRKG